MCLAESHTVKGFRGGRRDVTADLKMKEKGAHLTNLTLDLIAKRQHRDPGGEAQS